MQNDAYCCLCIYLFILLKVFSKSVVIACPLQGLEIMRVLCPRVCRGMIGNSFSLIPLVPLTPYSGLGQIKTLQDSSLWPSISSWDRIQVPYSSSGPDLPARELNPYSSDDILIGSPTREVVIRGTLIAVHSWKSMALL